MDRNAAAKNGAITKLVGTPPFSHRKTPEDRVDAVVSTIGAFGNYETMVRMCGQATVGALEVAPRVEVPRFVFISAHDYGFPVRSLVKGYYAGKQLAEKAIEETYPEGGVVLKPSAIFGKRILPGEDGKTIPLHVRLRAHAAVCHRAPVLSCLADCCVGIYP